MLYPNLARALRHNLEYASSGYYALLDAIAFEELLEILDGNKRLDRLYGKPPVYDFETGEWTIGRTSNEKA
ncbi:MAG: hypothetical protein C4555_04435 [Dehalococcoidia bacterium]|nr:MAG: hypothetical protein C4555_04435 [Dehalococcoidia bacterium]